MARECAIVRGYRVPDRDFVGSVHSVFASTCNVECGGLLVTLQDAARPLTPAAIGIRCPDGWVPRVRREDRATCRAGTLYVGDHIFTLQDVPVWSSPAASRPATLSIRRQGLKALRQAHFEAISPVSVRAIETDLRALGALFTKLDRPLQAAVVTSHVKRLIGAGPGLTPSGDDMLVGLLAALHRGGDRLPAAAIMFERIGSAVLTQRHRTTDISVHYLTLAVQGDFSAPLTALIDAVQAGQGGSVLQACIDSMLNIGATSGADALYGVIEGLTARFDTFAKDEASTSLNQREPFSNEDTV